MIELGDVVRLKEPYNGYTHGIVVEIISTFDRRYFAGKIGDETVLGVSFTKNLEKGMPRNVSLFLYKPTDHEHGGEETGGRGLEHGTAILRMAFKPADSHQVPMFVDFHVSELVLIQRARERYNPIDIDIAKVLGLEE